jgi:hypothetical protein
MHRRKYGNTSRRKIETELKVREKIDIQEIPREGLDMRVFIG